MNSTYQIFKEKVIPTIHKLFQKIREDGTILNSFHVTRIPQKLKADKGTTMKENYKLLPLVNIYWHNLQLIIDKLNMATHKNWNIYRECEIDLTSKNQSM